MLFEVHIQNDKGESVFDLDYQDKCKIKSRSQLMIIRKAFQYDANLASLVSMFTFPTYIAQFGILCSFLEY